MLRNILQFLLKFNYSSLLPVFLFICDIKFITFLRYVSGVLGRILFSSWLQLAMAITSEANHVVVDRSGPRVLTVIFSSRTTNGMD